MMLSSLHLFITVNVPYIMEIEFNNNLLLLLRVRINIYPFLTRGLDCPYHYEESICSLFLSPKRVCGLPRADTVELQWLEH